IDTDKKTNSIGNVKSSDDCDGVEHGWYYDSPDSPAKIFVCPQTCEWFQGQEDSEIVIKFGCETVPAVVT
ncbi:MAG: hypothetical protein GY847_34030, partial [Proteobacteria bacterium]|nr:hypothetical protein [Pseudomonadota bacterium]